MPIASPKTLLQDISQQLLAVYSKQEAETIALMLLENLLAIDRMGLLTSDKIELSTIQRKKLHETIVRLLNHEPIQHIVGKAHFYGRFFQVNKHTLVPRQETEELVALIKNEMDTPTPSILDIGTGTGCIACTLALEIPDARVSALDISEKALAVAQANSEALRSKVDFYQVDVLKQELPISELDTVVSNPPYVLEKEKRDIPANVLNFDPHLALFVPDADPLLFYRVILKHTQHTLKPRGRVYFEINERFGKETAGLLDQFNFGKITVHQDLNGKDRFVSAARI